MLALQMSKDHLQIIFSVHWHEFLVIKRGILPAGLPKLLYRGISDGTISPKLSWIQPANSHYFFKARHVNVQWPQKVFGHFCHNLNAITLTFASVLQWVLINRHGYGFYWMHEDSLYFKTTFKEYSAWKSSLCYLFQMIHLCLL